ncbi:hypothetical protein [Halalkalicoccus sp. NIPERK01]|uniref:hypothetical protein n=1 Tax=Halalkalicoccus sp. NIPERK01 TaxID=3053469 RepID=UPI00256F16C6|nr:hypothetical protein [Halalkalicoccus sp. NIPERK01]MDL5360914.1 hypothetical protein [Halalkalicoccus sp. NIPERK01]
MGADGDFDWRITRRGVIRTAAAAGLAGTAGLAGADQTTTRPVSDGPESPTLSIADRLADRRYVVSGTRAYVAGTQTGRFPAMGWHVPGEMEGIWSPPIKLLDGIWFDIDGETVGPATRFSRGYGFAEMELPRTGGVALRRTEVVPDDGRAVLIGLRLDAGEDEETVTLGVEAASELMDAYPWGDTDPSQEAFNLEDEGEFDGERLVFRSEGTPPVKNAAHRDWAAAVGATLAPTDGEVGDGGEFRGPQDDWAVYDPEGGGAESDDAGFERHDDSTFGRGAGGRLEYEVCIPASETRTVWFAVGGSESGPDAAIEECEAALSDPEGALSEKVEERLERRERTRLDLPGNRRLEEAIDWTKQNLSDLVQESRDLQVRVTNAGENYPEPAGTIDRARFVGAGYPDFPWLFAVDGEYTAFASVALGQFEPIKEHMRALRDVSEVANEGSGKVVHEVITDGSVFYGANDDPGNTDETAKFPSAVALIWRWSGDDEFRDEMYDFTKRSAEYLLSEFGAADGWPIGEGNVERPGMGERVLDNAVYTIRGLYDLADMAASKGDDETVAWATERADELLAEFEEAWWVPEVPGYADSLDDADTPLYHRHWIGLTPLEIELPRDRGARTLGLAGADDGNDALALRETECYGGVGAPEGGLDGEWNPGLYHTGAPGCDRNEYEHAEDHAERNIYTLNSAIMAVAAGNYGRLAADQQGRFVDANASLQLPDPDEMPGAMPEVVPSPKYGRSIDKPFTDRLMALQAWGSYGTVWPVVGQRLGVRPDVGRGRLEVTPQIPAGESRIGAENVRVGDGAVDIEARAGGREYTTTVCADASLDRLVVGHTVPGDAEVVGVTLDGEDADCEVRETNRGREVVVETDPDGERTLVVETQQ